VRQVAGLRAGIDDVFPFASLELFAPPELEVASAPAPYQL
jgi:hypothetical protein